MIDIQHRGDCDMSLRSSASAYAGLAAARPARKVPHGFTLIELMIVVAVIAILASIAYPSYMDSVRKSRRGQAKADMVELAQLLERYHTENNTYVGFPLPFAQSPKTGTARYTLAILPAATAATFGITATPQGGQASDTCGTLTLDHAGRKQPTTAGCWQ